MTLFPNVLNSLEALTMPLQASISFNQVQMQSIAASVDMYKNTQDLTQSLQQSPAKHVLRLKRPWRWSRTMLKPATI